MILHQILQTNLKKNKFKIRFRMKIDYFAKVTVA